MTDSFLAEFDRRRARRTTTSARETLYQATPVNPDRAAEAQRIAAALNLAPDMVYRDPSYDRDYQARRNAEALDGAPRTAAFMSDRNNAEVAHDQVRPLSDMERRIAAGPLAGQTVDTYEGPAPTIPNLIRGLSSSFMGGFRLSREGGSAQVQDFLDWVVPDQVQARNEFLQPQRSVTQRNIREAQGSMALARPNIENRYARWTYGGVESLVRTAPGIGASILTRSPLPALATAGVQTETEAYGKYRERGATAGEAAGGAVLEGAVEVGTELLPMGFIVDRFGKGGAKAFIGGLLARDLPSEQVATLAQDAVDTAIANPDKTWQDYWAERPEAAAQTLVSTLVQTGAVGGASAAGSGAARAIDGYATRRAGAQQAQAANTAFNEMAAEVQANPLTQRSPERMQAFLETVTDGASVYVPAEKVVEFFQSNPDFDGWLDEWVIRDQVEEAAAAGTDVAFDQALYMTRVAGTEAGGAWQTDVRLGLDAMSLREAETFASEGETRLQTDIDTAISDAAETVDSEQQVREAVQSQLREAGYTAEAARTNAAVAAAFFTRRAATQPERFSDAMAAYQDAGLSIRQEFPQVVRERMDRLDSMVETLRRGRAAPSAKRMFGRSMMEFLAAEGGVLDTGGELTSLGVEAWHRPKQGGRAFRRRFIRGEEQGGNQFAPDQAALRAVEAGYLPEGAGPNELFEAVREELSGRPRYSQQFEADLQGQQNREALDELERVMSELGVSLDDSNADIKAALEGADAPAEERADSKTLLQRVTAALRSLVSGPETVAEEQPLYVVHNLSAEKLRHANRLGGLAAPSLAVARGDIGMEGFGEISLIGAPSLADPKRKGTRVFNADVYSPRQPRARHKIDRAALKSLQAIVEPVADSLGLSIRFDQGSVEQDGLSAVMSEAAVKAAWLQSVGEEVPVQYEEVREPTPLEGMEAFSTTDAYELLDDPAFMAAVRARYDAAIERAGENVDMVEKVNGAWLDPRDPTEISGEMLSRWASRVVQSNRAVAQYEAGPKTSERVDRYATSRAIDETIGDRIGQFDAWVEDEFGGVVTDLFFETEAGSKRAYTLENIVREMTRTVRNGERWNYGAGNVRAAVAPEFTSLEGVKGARSKIVSESDMDALKNEINSDLLDLADEFAPYHGSGTDFGWGDIFSEFMKDLAKGPRQLAEWQTEIFSEPVPDELIAKAGAFLERLRDLPTNYFEIKMQRAVALSEFEAAIVPTDTREDAKAILRDAGLEVIEYDRGANGDAAESNRTAVLASIGDRVFFQETLQDKRGSITFADGRAAIRLFAARDMSTFLHEFGHLSLELMMRDAADPAATDAVRADAQVVLDWFSKESGETVTAETIGVDQHELWARGFERYLFEGKAPSLSLRAVFRSVASWLRGIYRTVSGLNAPITDDVRSVMDRMLASQEEIDQAQQAMGFETAEGLDGYGMTEAQTADMVRLIDRAKTTAQDELLGRIMRAIRRRETKAWNDADAEVRPEITLDVEAMPDMAALDMVTNGGQRLDREAVVAMMGGEGVLSLLPSRIPTVYVEGGVHPDTIADAAGFTSGAEMIGALMSIEAERVAMKANGDKRSVKRKRIDDAVQAELLNRFGDALNDGSIEAEAQDVLHSERYGDLLAVQLNFWGRKVGQQPSPIQALRQWAAERIGSRPASEAKSGRYLRAERKAANAVQAAITAKDDREVYRQKNAQTINNVLFAAASRAEREVEAAVARMKRLSGRVKSIDWDYQVQINALLEQFDLRNVSQREVGRRQSLLEFVQEKQDANEPINIPASLIAAAQKTHYSQLTVDELRALDEAVQNLAHLGRLKNRLKVRGEQRSLEQLAAEAVAAADGFLPDVKGSESPGEMGMVERLLSFGAKLEAANVKAQEYFRLLDGNNPTGVFTSVLDTDGQEAANRRVALSETFWNPVLAVERLIPASVKAKWNDTLANHPIINPTTKAPFLKIKRRDLIGMARQVGTLSNFEKAAKGWGLVKKDADQLVVEAARETFIRWLDSQMDPTEWDYVQAMWDAHERLRPDYFAAARAVEGFEPEPVEAMAVQLGDRTLAGGYVPISYDPEFDAGAERREQKEATSMFGDIMQGSPRPDNGATNARTAYVGFVRLKLADARFTAEKQITYAAYAEYVTNALKFIRQPDIAALVKRKLGLSAYRSLEPWLGAQVKDEAIVDPAANAIVRVAQTARANMTSAVLLGSFSVLAAQPGGLAQSYALLGNRWFASGIGSYLALAKSGKVKEFITSRSEFMRLRLEQGDLDRDFRLAMQRSAGATGVRERMTQVAGKAIAMVDFYGVAGSTWMGAWDKALSEGRSEEDAAVIADQAVRRTQGGGRAIDQAGIMRSNEFLKMSTFAFGWANALYNMERQAIVDFKNGNDRLENAMRLASLVVLVPLADALLSGDLPGGGEDDDEGFIKSTIDWFTRNVLYGTMAGIPFVRDFAGSAERRAAGQYAGPVGTTPIGRISEEVLKLSDDGRKALDFDEETEVSRRWPSHLLMSTGLVLGIPGTTQASRTTNYLTDVSAGEQEPETWIDWVSGVIKGPRDDQK